MTRPSQEGGVVFKRIDHLALHVRDLGKCVAFYEDVLGFRKYAEHTVPAPAGISIAYLRLGDTVLELTHLPGAGLMKGFHFCLEVEDFNQAIAHMEAKGVRVLQPPHPTRAREPREEGWRRVVYEGPEGEEIELRG
jgi:lactoylglutathione lyase